jgi:hypothetical protein
MEVLVSGRASERSGDLIIETIGQQYYNHPDPDTEPLRRSNPPSRPPTRAQRTL